MKKHLVILALAMLAAPVFADVDAATDAKIRESLKTLLPSLTPDEVRSTPVDGLYELTFGARVAYVTEDGRHLLQGKLVDLQTREDLTENRLSELKLAALAGLSEDTMVIFGPEDARHTVTVFTDIDCGFCRKLHAEMASYNEQGIRVRYLFYPRAGVGSDSYNKAVSVWCADDRKAAMDLAKAGKPLDRRTCDNPVDEHLELGQSMRIQGTPALMLADGEIVPGYVPADKLGKALDAAAGLAAK